MDRRAGFWVSSCRASPSAVCGSRFPPGRRWPPALVTDIGNDLFYDHPLERIVGWIDFCLARLAAISAHRGHAIAAGQLAGAFASEDFGCCGKFFFPGVDRVLRRWRSVPRRSIERVVELARAYGAQTISPPRTWYGFDAIHIRLRKTPRAWREILLSWSPDRRRRRAVPPSPLRALYLNTVFPERQRVFGREWQVRQPSGKLPDGTTLWLY